MRILKIKGKDEQTVLDQIKKEYGQEAIIINTSFERSEGLFKFLKKSVCVVTIAIKNEEVSKDLDTRDMFNFLKNQIEEIKQDIAGAKLLSHHPSLLEQEQKTTIYSVMREKLCKEGIQEEVVSNIVEGLEEGNLECAARQLYTRIHDMMPDSKEDRVPQIICFVGSTGVGKTTTIAKLTADYVMNKQKRVALFTADTYRIAAIEQLRTYAEILGVPLEVIYSEKDLELALDKWKHMDHIFIDTAGRSHKNVEQMKDIGALLKVMPAKKVYLVLSVNTAYKDVKRIVDQYKTFADKINLIITKLDETDEIGNLMNIVSYAQSPITYITNGQNVPDDIQSFNCDEYIKDLLGRINDE